MFAPITTIIECSDHLTLLLALTSAMPMISFINGEFRITLAT